METNKLNEKLKQLYIDKLSAGNPCILQLLREQRRNADKSTQPAYPLLIKINEERYKNADLKIMVFGQETNGWETKVSKIQIPIQDSCYHVAETVNAFMDNYFNFRNKKDYNSPFLNTFKTISELAGELNCELVWNNIYKIGNRERNKNRPNKVIRELENIHFDVIQEEISILKPDVILFLTGPNYDARVNKKFEITGYHSISNQETRKLAKISISVEMLAYRTYHPGYLRRQSKLDEYLKHIIADVKKEFINQESNQ
jgi:hypothetical protein